MSNIMHITDESLGLPAGSADETTSAKREAARGIVFNSEGQIALLFAGRDNYHKLPGGGIEDGEDWRIGFQRESVEEIGCETSIRPLEMGTVTESRSEHQLLQTSYCCIADVVGEMGQPQLTEHEIEVGLKPKWVMLDEAIELVAKDQPQSYAGKFIQVRDLAFLAQAKALLA